MIFLCFANYGYAQHSTEANNLQNVQHFLSANRSNVAANQARFIVNEKKTDSGWLQARYYMKNQEIEMQGLYEDSALTIPNGTFYYFYPHKKLKAIEKYVHGKREGTWVSYFENEYLKDSSNYKDDHPVGTVYSWYSTGFPKDSVVYQPDGEAVSVSWFRNGKLSAAGRYTHWNVPTRTWVYYHDNGIVSAKEQYDQGMLVNKFYYNEKGEAIDTTNRDSEAKFDHGKWSEYLSKHLYFPSSYKFVNGNKAEDVVLFIIDTKGDIIEARVDIPFEDAFDRIALNGIRSCKSKWIPEIAHNRYVESEQRQMVIYNDINY
ncbi:toxin-antitoxin system YwqK family antitoxin [Rhizosphaericola mali]|uniref:TonB C-terminal domain-containing protein n=1 Tax=Rhizosphaericola mali TaxID=2545455 RepID=A0A5P2G9H6_9BACT|nr:hypothetical protein [Rhizosphaericola mali]QES89863.1 hypothetical protein E0W69_014760 [Rhizosphaericola mali]